ncbi:MAG: DnaJ domain-containing protein [Polyangiaceae bacterium]|nr:DnaJ domain-containing protein [Polyangiaceae bacterium]
MRGLPIGPEEAFVLSRVDGRTSEADIAAATGMEQGRIQETLTRLAELGAIEYGALPPPTPPPPSEEHPSVPPGRRLARPIVETTEVHGSEWSHPAAALYDPAELDEAVDLELPRKRMILDRFYRLDSANHYEVLGVEPGADKKEIKDAYFRAVSVLHPDRYFGKNLGNFKPKLDRIFQHLTEAHDVLTRKQSREEYDAYLATQAKNRDLEQLLGDERSQAQELEKIRRRIEEEARVAERATYRPEPRPADPEARRRALARKLRGSIPPGQRSSAPPAPSAPPASKAQVQEHVAEDLRRRYEQRLVTARGDQVQRYVDAAEAALKERNVVNAANALRIAASLAPDDQSLADRLQEVQQRANTELADSYLDQARYEERNGRPLEAAASYERAARGKPSAIVWERAAACLLEGDGDLRHAAELAKKAIRLASKAAEPRSTLAKIYVNAGMKESALLEFERASQLAPDDDSIKDWIKRLKRGDA